MGYEPHDQDIIQLLGKLKDAGGEYPEHMMVARRHSYLKRMAEISMGIAPEQAAPEAPQNPAPSTPPASSATTIIETALVVAILAEAAAVAYFYRDRLADAFETITAQASMGVDTPAPAVTTALEIEGVTPSAAIAPTLPSATLSPSASATSVPLTSTSSPATALAGDQNNSSTVAGTQQANSTPVPNINNSGNVDNGNNGNHYGQTPKPERTKESNPNDDNSNNNNSTGSDQNADPLSNNEPKPTKDK